MELNKKKFREQNKTDSESLFNAAWRVILNFEKCSQIDDLQGLYDTIVSEKVNDPKSKFYIYG